MLGMHANIVYNMENKLEVKEEGKYSDRRRGKGEQRGSLYQLLKS